MARARARLAAVLALAALLGGPPSASAGPAPAPPDTARAFPTIAILAYHDISDDSTAPLQTVPAEFLREQIRACKADGWTFLSLGELLAQRDHPDRLPPRVMVLTFDDGYRSFVEKALPVLRAEGVRATLAIITSFVEQPPPDLAPLLTWAEIRPLDASGEVEIASHSHALHRYETSNPWRDTAPSVATRRWLPAANRYEDREEYRSRVGNDLVDTQKALAGRLGHPATTLAWPYGVHNEMARGLAARAGFAATLTLEWRPVGPEDLRSGTLPRIMVHRRMTFADPSRAWLHEPAPPIRAAEVDLDALWDPDESVFGARLDQTVARVRALGATHVILPVCPDPRGDGRLLRAYAMNHQLPVLADVWSMAAARFSAARLAVWARVPALNLTWAWERHPEWRIAGGDRAAGPWGTRLAPDLPSARRAAVDFLTDLAVYLPLEGVVFDEDAMMLPGERLALERNADPAAKSAAIRGLLEPCKQAVRAWRPDCRFARIVAADAVERAGVHPKFAQDYAECLANDDVVIVRAVSATSGARRTSPAAIARLAHQAAARWRASRPAANAAGTPPVLLMLPAYDVRRHDWIPAASQQAAATAALAAGVAHLGSGPVAASGELPIGLLDDRGAPPAARVVERRY